MSGLAKVPYSFVRASIQIVNGMRCVVAGVCSCHLRGGALVYFRF
jgi:hypothetical protein